MFCSNPHNLQRSCSVHLRGNGCSRSATAVLEVLALYAEVCAALDRQKAQVTPEAVFEAVEEVAGGVPLSPERHAQAIYAAE